MSQKPSIFVTNTCLHVTTNLRGSHLEPIYIHPHSVYVELKRLFFFLFYEVEGVLVRPQYSNFWPHLHLHLLLPRDPDVAEDGDDDGRGEARNDDLAAGELPVEGAMPVVVRAQRRPDEPGLQQGVHA